MGRQRIEKLMTDLQALHGVTGGVTGRVEFPEGTKPTDRIQSLLWALDPQPEGDTWEEIWGDYDKFVSDRPYLQG